MLANEVPGRRRAAGSGAGDDLQTTRAPPGEDTAASSIPGWTG